MAGLILGLDFGTTNSLAVSIDPRTQKPRAYTDIRDDRPHPSTVWYRAGDIVVGRDARARMDSGDEAVSGEFVRSPKRLLIRQSPVNVDGSQRDPRQIVAEVLKYIRSDAGASQRGNAAVQIEQAVFTIPVNLDGFGRRALRDAAMRAGIGVVQFVHEPLAALYAWLRTQADFARRVAELDGRRLLVFDWGGGTLDLTLCLVRDGKLIQIANDGDNEVGGDFFDDVLRAEVRRRHAEEHGLENVTALENGDSGTRLLNQCEQAKIALSDHDTFTVFVSNYLRSEKGRNLKVEVTRRDIEEWTAGLINRGLACIDRLIQNAGLSPQEIELCLPTGGMVNVAAIRSGLVERFRGRVPKLENGDRIIAEGAAWIAHDGLRLTLAKPIELTEPFGGHIEIVDVNQLLPLQNQTVPVHKSQYYCTDPRDGIAKFQISRPVKAGQAGPADPRKPYVVLHVKVSPTTPPLAEKLQLQVSIDHDYVAHVTATSSLMGDKVEKEIFDLEFALAMNGFGEGASVLRGGEREPHQMGDSPTPRGAQGNVLIKTNVSPSNDWKDVPGELVVQYYPRWFDPDGSRASQLQRVEYFYYQPCSLCGRNLALIDLEGCDCGHTLSPEAARRRRESLNLNW